MLRRVNQRVASVAGVALASALPAGTTEGAPLFSNYRTAAASSSAFSSHVMSSRGFIKFRMHKADEAPNANTNGSDASSSSSSAPSVSGDVFKAEDDTGNAYQIEWNSTNFYRRLGLNKKCTDKEIRARYIDLAKKYHPDLASASNKNLPPHVKPEEVFKNIKEAYEALSDPNKRAFIDARGWEEFKTREEQGFGVSGDEFARQQAIKQLFADGLPFFLASVALFLGVMAYHFRSRIGTADFFHFFVILLVLTFFPRILAAVIMYLMHCNDLIAVFEKEAQAAALVSVTATQSTSAPTAPAKVAAGTAKDAAKKEDTSGYVSTAAIMASGVLMDVTIRAEGLEERVIPEGNMVVTVKRVAPKEESDAKEVAAAVSTSSPAPASDNSTTNKDAAAAVAEPEEVFVFEKGVTAVTLPLMLPSKQQQQQTAAGIPSPTWEMHVRYVNDGLKITAMDKKAFL